MLLCGETPFGGCGDGESMRAIRDNILAGRYKFEPQDGNDCVVCMTGVILMNEY